MTQKVRLITEDGNERVGYIDMRTFRDAEGRHWKQRIPKENWLDVSKPLTFRNNLATRPTIKIWFTDSRYIYGAYQYEEGWEWHLHRWQRDGSAMARIKPHNTDLVYKEDPTHAP